MSPSSSMARSLASSPVPTSKGLSRRDSTKKSNFGNESNRVIVSAVAPAGCSILPIWQNVSFGLINSGGARRDAAWKMGPADLAGVCGPDHDDKQYIGQHRSSIYGLVRHIYRTMWNAVCAEGPSALLAFCISARKNNRTITPPNVITYRIVSAAVSSIALARSRICPLLCEIVYFFYERTSGWS